MINVTRINGEPIVVNSDLIEHLEFTPDTVLALTNGQRFLVKESAEEVIRRIVTFRQELNRSCATAPSVVKEQ